MSILFLNVQNVKESQGKINILTIFGLLMFFYRPHTLLFDETYEEAYYRGQSVLKALSSMDCLVVIGTALETSLATNIVCQAVTQKKLIIEINPEPIITYGNVRHLKGGADTFLPKLCELAQKKLIENKNKA